MSGTIVVFGGGDPPDPERAAHLDSVAGDDAFVIAADAGVDRAIDMGRRVDLAVGDMDSVRPETLDRLVAGGTEVRRHPARKDRTDLELALDAALERSPDRVVVTAISGGRIDHELAALLVLANPDYREMRIDAIVPGGDIAVVHDSRRFRGRVGDRLSLLAMNGDADGVTTRGLEYPLVGATLVVGTAHGVSNVFIETTAEVSLSTGVLFALRPRPELE